MDETKLNSIQVEAETGESGLSSRSPSPAPERCVLEIESLAFESKQADRGYTVKASYLTQPKGDALVEIFKDGLPLRAFLFPAYKVWDIAAHFKDIVDGEIDGNASGYEMAAWNGISNALFYVPERDAEILNDPPASSLQPLPESDSPALKSALEDEYVAWCRYVNHGQDEDSGADILTIEVCDSDSDGAFKVYARPDSHLALIKQLRDALVLIAPKCAKCGNPAGYRSTSGMNWCSDHKTPMSYEVEGFLAGYDACLAADKALKGEER